MVPTVRTTDRAVSTPTHATGQGHQLNIWITHQVSLYSSCLPWSPQCCPCPTATCPWEPRVWWLASVPQLQQHGTHKTTAQFCHVVLKFVYF